MRQATKFTFDTVFDAQRNPPTESSRARQRTMLSDAELESMRAEARAEGARAAEIVAREAVAAGTREAETALRQVLARVDAEMEALRAEAASVAFALATKIAGEAVASYPAGVVEATLRHAMHEALGEPRIVLRARPDVADALSERMAAIAQDEGYEGRVQISADASLKGADCRVDWRGGGVERTGAAIEAALSEVVARRLAAPDSAIRNGSES